MAVYNEEPVRLAQAIRSICKQTYSNFEFVIVDDGSERWETISTLKTAAERDPRIRLFRNPHLGLTRALNFGLKQCRGQLICRQDSDDWSDHTRLERQVTFLMQHPHVGVVGSFVALYREHGEFLWVKRFPETPDDVARCLPRENPFVHGAVCFRRSLAESVGGYREEFAFAQDYDFLWRVCERSAGANIPAVLYHHRITRGSISYQRAREQLLIAEVVRQLATMRQHGEIEDYARAVQRAEEILGTKSTCLGLLQQGDRLMLAGYYLAAARLYARAVRCSPLSLTAWLKLFRWTVYGLLPPFRRLLFRG